MEWGSSVFMWIAVCVGFSALHFSCTSHNRVLFSVCGGVGVLFSGGVSPEYLGHQTSNSSLEPAVCH